MTPALRRHIEESREQYRARAAELARARDAMTRAHRTQRVQMVQRQQVQWDSAARERAARLPTGLKGLWHRLTGKFQEIRRDNEDQALRLKERLAAERERLIGAQRDERAALQTEFKKLRSAQAVQLLELRKEIGRYLKFTRPSPSLTPAQDLNRSSGLGLKR